MTHLVERLAELRMHLDHRFYAVVHRIASEA